MKKLLLMIPILCACISSCSSSSEDGATDAPKVNVKFIVNNLDVSYKQKGVALKTAGITDLWIWEGTELLKHQKSTDSDFGSPTLSLATGKHNIVFVASKSEGQTFSEGNWTCTKVNETFGKKEEFTVTSSAQTRQVDLLNLTAKLQWTVEDAIPTAAKTATITYPQNYKLGSDLYNNNTPTSPFTNETETIDITSLQGKTNQRVAEKLIITGAAAWDAKPKISFSNGVNYTTDCTIMGGMVTNIHGIFFPTQDKITVTVNNTWIQTLDFNIDPNKEEN